MIAGMAAKMMLIEAIRHLPANSERSSRSISRADDAVKRSTMAGPVPRVLLSWIPLIDRLSSIVTFRSASSRWRCAVMARRSTATLRARYTDGGITISEISESRHDSAAIATAVAIAVVRFEATDVAV